MIYDRFCNLIDDFSGRFSNALVFEDRDLPLGQGSLSYAEFGARIKALTAEIRSEGTRTDFVKTAHTPGTLIRIFADICAGCTVVLLDPMLPPLREQMIRKLLEPKLAVMSSSPAAAAEDSAASHLSASPAAAAGTSPGPVSVKQESSPAEGRLVFFTSGTTHSSKAVVLSAKALLHASWRGQECLPIGEGDTLLSILPLSHVFGFVCTMLWGLCYGAAVALGRGVRHLMDDPKFFRPTVLPLVPTLAGAMTRFGCYNPELKVVLIGAAPLSGNELQAMKHKTSAKIYTGYGLTETASGVAITEDPDDPYSLRVCPGVELKLGPDNEILLKTDSLLERYIELVPVSEKVEAVSEKLGTVSEKLGAVSEKLGTLEEVHGQIREHLDQQHEKLKKKLEEKGLAAPSLGSDVKSALKKGQDSLKTAVEKAASDLLSAEVEPFLDSEGFFHTGDIGAFDNNGRIHISGRKKDIIVLPDGTKVFCPEYEKALSDALGTDELAVTGRNGRAILLVSDKVRKETAEKVVAQLNQRLSRSQQIAGITYINVPLPRTVTGKLKRWMIEKAIQKGDFSVWKE